jgi:hypothetical protein
MKSFRRAIIPAAWLVLITAPLNAQQPFPVTATVNEPSIAGRSVALDAQSKLLPWPMPDHTGYSYSSYFLSNGQSSGIKTIVSVCPTSIAVSISIALRLK